MIVVWKMTQRCNLSCSFCAYDRRLTWPRRQADVEEIRRFGSLLAQSQRDTGDSILVSWIGGEPFLFSPLEALTVFFTKHLGLRVSATTNGTTLSRASVRDHVLAHYSELTVSVDGIGAVHDGLRGWPGGYAAVREAVVQLATAKRARQQGPLLRANVVLMRQTLKDFERLCLELADWGIEEITYNQLGGRDRPEFFPTHRLMPGHALWLANELPRLQAQMARRGVRLNGSGTYLSRILASSRDEAVPVANCHPGETFLFINEAGLASPCSFTGTEYGVPIRELQSARALRDLPALFAQARRERRSHACLDCHSTQVFEKFTN